METDFDLDLEIAVQAVLDRREAKWTRDAAYRRMVAHGWSTLKIEREMRARLLEEGLTVRELDPGDRNPPVGALVFWSIRDGHPGHIALSAGDGKIISTDVPTDRRVGIRPMSYFDGYSGYLGWALPFFTERTGS